MLKEEHSNLNGKFEELEENMKKMCLENENLITEKTKLQNQFDRVKSMEKCFIHRGNTETHILLISVSLGDSKQLIDALKDEKSASI